MSMFGKMLSLFTVFVAVFTSLISMFVRGAEIDKDILDINYFLSHDNVVFESIDSSALSVTEEEKKICRDWYENNVISTDRSRLPAYDFNYGIKSLRRNFSEWTFTGSRTTDKYSERGCENTVVTLTDGEFEVTVDAVLYPQKAICSWTLSLKNVSDKNSAIVSEFSPINSVIPVTDDSVIYYNRGSNHTNADFDLLSREIYFNPVSFDCIGGTSSQKYLPYFNLNDGVSGCTLAVGWTGEWLCRYTPDLINHTLSAQVKQASLTASLSAGEEIRTPSVSLGFYGNANPLKGYTNFRQWMLESVMPDNSGVTDFFELAGPTSTRTTQEILDNVGIIPADFLDTIDYFWMDAGWYTDGDWSESVGTYTVDSRYPNGIIEIAEFGKEKGIGLTLWYEPERIAKDTDLWLHSQTSPGFVIKKKDKSDVLINLADDETLAYLEEFISSSIKENGVSFYRQDMNTDTDVFWEARDRKLYGRVTGLTENHYVTNLYKYLDFLVDDNPGLRIDNCASGGRRLDIEMCSRSVPAWRSDYQCFDVPDLMEAYQVQTSGLGLWLPVSGSVIKLADGYQARSTIMPLELSYFGAYDMPDYNNYSDVRGEMLKNEFPLTDLSINAPYCATQFGDEQSGVVLVYRRSGEDMFVVRFSGLDTNTVYNVYSYDDPDSITALNGDTLMKAGYAVSFTDTPQALILCYKPA